MRNMTNYYSIKQLKKIKWGVLEENNPISLFPVMYPGWSIIIEKTKKILGKPQQSASCLHTGLHGIIFIDHHEWNELGEYALRKILRYPSFVEKINKKIFVLSDRLSDFTDCKIFTANLKNKTNLELLKLYQLHQRWHSELYVYAIIPVYLEMYKPHLTKYLVEYLFGQVNRIHYQLSAKECFAYLTVPEKFSQIQLEEQAFLKLAKKFSNNLSMRKIFVTTPVTEILKKLPTAYAAAVRKHVTAYCYQGYNFEGPAFNDIYFLTRWKEFLISGSNAGETLRQIFKDKKRALELQKQIIKDLKIDQKYQRLFNVTREIIYGKDYRKMAMVKSYYHLEPLLYEIGRRINLSLAEVRNCLLNEIEGMLVRGEARPAQLLSRMKGCYFAVVGGKLPGVVDTGALYYKMKSYLLKKEDLSQVNYFHGQTAMTGKARGIVKIINTKNDLPKMNVGDILVAKMTNPDLVPAMKKAAAVITDTGGITCHAAIVSRELKIPCVIGTKVATKILKDGDEVLVDANQGEIKKI